ncbi:unnamed protein product [Citrullus colocynthis]|uniref:Uncharacterized protein n=1 Tax=Citrullus colocynthis TaxID=252529 RepID=A0ABP0Z5M8_9ROSI
MSPKEICEFYRNGSFTPHVWRSTAWQSPFAISIGKRIIRFNFRTFFLLHWTVSPFHLQPFPLSLMRS